MADAQITRLLQGDAADSERLLELVYQQLRRIAQQKNWPILELGESSSNFPTFLRPAKAL